MNEKEKDNMVRMRKLLVRRHQGAKRKVLSLSSRVLQTNVTEEREEMLRKEGEVNGLCYALKALDKTCQTEFGL